MLSKINRKKKTCPERKRKIILLLISGFMLLTSISVGEEVYLFETKWGSLGSGNGQFNFPQGVAVDSFGNVYVTEINNQRIQKFTSIGTFITKWGSFGSGNGQFNNPEDLVVDSSGNIYVADGKNHRIQKFTSTGTFITKWGSFGSGDGQFNYPNGVSVDSSGNVYVVEYNNHRVQKFTSTGTFITKWGSSGSGDGQFSFPYGIAIDSLGNVYVVDGNNHRIQKFKSSGAGVSGDLKNVKVYPNPYNPSKGHTKIIFANFTTNATIKIFDFAGEIVWEKENITTGSEEWLVVNKENEPIASGIYIYLITDKAGNKTSGKLAIIR